MSESIMPEIKIIAPIERTKTLLKRSVAVYSGIMALGRSTEYCLTKYPKKGAATVLDEHLDHQPTLPFEEGGRWSDMGTY